MRLPPAPFAFAALIAIGGCAASPSPDAGDRGDLVTGSHLPKKVRPGDSMQVYRPTPGDVAGGDTGVAPPVSPAGSR